MPFFALLPFCPFAIRVAVVIFGLAVQDMQGAPDLREGVAALS
jgi:hypothetical protein